MEARAIVPNGFGDAPHLDASNPASLGQFLGWMGGVVSHTYTEVAALSSWRRELEDAQLMEAEAKAERVRQEDAKKRWWDRTKTRAETVGVLCTACATSFGVGAALFRFVL